VTKFRDGDQVFGFTGFAFGTYAEYICLPQKALVTSKPSNLDYDEAAAIPYGGLLAMHYLRKGGIRGRRKVLVYGASGAVGTAAIQLASHFGADVTGVCSTANLGLISSLGASAVIDYTKEDFSKKGERYDLILVAVGGRVHPPSKEECVKALAPEGAYVSVDQGRPKPLTEDLVLLQQLAEAGQLKPVIDRTYQLDQMVEAHRYVDKERKKGNVVITVA
jgi:NADPH:quinone reductase-like Zn-dependent oxidoreductase